MIENCEILRNESIGESYRRIVFSAPAICPKVKPGQFVHVQIANLRDRLLRRPFSICDVGKKGELTVIYKIVGEGTAVLAALPAGTVCSIMGPQGIPFSVPGKNEYPVIVAGGYGSAATYILAQRSPVQGKILMGARTSSDLILTGEFKDAGFEVLLATEDGSLGEKGYVTKLLDDVLKTPPAPNVRFYGCGPHGMLMAMGKMLLQNGLDGELSLDHLMCCGIGACYACVVKVKDSARADGWRYARTCKEGPVFSARIIHYD